MRTHHRSLEFVVFSLLWAGAAVAESRFALSIGSNIGAGEDELLRWAERDAQRFDALLGQLGDVSEDRRLVLLGEGVEPLRLALSRVRGRIEEARRRGERTVLFVYYSGHGDTQALRFGGERLPLTEFRSLLEQVPATTTVTIIDACHSGALVRGREKGLSRGPSFDVSLVRQAGPEGRVLLTSSASYEVAQESDALQGSYFTHHLVSGLRGAADGDGDGRVSLSEAYRHVYHRTLVASHESTAAVQHPALESELAGEGELVLTRLDRSQAELTLPGDVTGSVMVVEERTLQVVAEVEPRGGSAVRLALPSGRYRVQVRQGQEVRVGSVFLAWGAREVLNVEKLESRTLAQHQRKGALAAPEWRVSIGGGVAGGHTSATGAGPLLSATFLRTAAEAPALSLFVALSRPTGENAALRFAHGELEVLGQVGALRPFGPLLGGLHAAAGTVAVLQRAASRDAERFRQVTGQDPVLWRSGVGGVLAAVISVDVPLGSKWSLATRGEARLTAIQESGQLHLQPGLAVTLGVGFSL